MKRIFVIVAVLILIFGAMGCSTTDKGTWIPGTPPPGSTQKWAPGHWSNETSPEESDLSILPSYTADQVVYIAQAKYPACYRRQNGMDVQTPPSITVVYVGGSRAAWKVQISCPPLYSLGQPLSGVNSLTLYFWETDGSLHSTVR